jgi:predicted LPLAT superfamily acyltransferase
MDEKTEALLGPEPVVDPAAQAALERRVEEEDYRLRMKLGGRAAAVAAGALIVVGPFLSGLGAFAPAWPWILWAIVNLPLLVLVALVWRRDRLPLGRGHFLTGRAARRLALWLFLASLAAFFGPGLARDAWHWLLGGG